MNKSAVLFAFCSLVAGGVGLGQPPADFGPPPGYSNPGFNPEHQYRGPVEEYQYHPGDPMVPYDYTEHDARPLFYKPTMRYYGNGYTVSYRYVPVYRTDIGNSKIKSTSSNFPTDTFLLSPDQVNSWGANLPRLTVKDNSSNGPRPAVTSIVHKKTTTTRTSTRSKTKDTGSGDNTPAVQPGTAPLPAPDSSPSPAPKQ